MKTSLLEEIDLGGREDPEKYPILAKPSQSPSKILNQSQLEINKNKIERLFDSLHDLSKRSSPGPLGPQYGRSVHTQHWPL